MLEGPDLNVNAIDAYFGAVTDINNFSMSGGGGGGGYASSSKYEGVHYDEEKGWYFDKYGNPVSGDFYCENVAPQRTEAVKALNETIALLSKAAKIENNYQNVEGLSICYFDDNGTYSGAADFLVIYTHKGIEGANWSHRMCETHDSGGSECYWDGDISKSQKFQFYYSQKDLAKHNDGNMTWFFDHPFISAGILNADLTLQSQVQGTILTIKWGFTYRAGRVEGNDIVVFYHKF